MTVYEKNLNAMKEYQPKLLEAFLQHTPSLTHVYVGEAEDGEPFLAIMQGEAVCALNSIYNPSHAAERYVLQLKELAESTTLIMVGLNDAAVLRRILNPNCPVKQVIVYEPDPEIFLAALQNFDLTDLFRDPNLEWIVQGLNHLEATGIIYNRVNFIAWKTFSIIALPYYSAVYPDEMAECYGWYQYVLTMRHSEQVTLAEDYSEAAYKNVVLTQKWLIRSKSIKDLEKSIDKSVPWVLVAAGPSLEKNAHVLKKIKGKACIVAVERACKYLLQEGIIPDFVCSIDSDKEMDYLCDERMRGIPYLISTESCAASLESLPEFTPIFMRLTSEFYNELLAPKGKEIWFHDGGGSVATMAFRLLLSMDIQTIVIIGQDLAFTDNQFHAGVSMEEEQDEFLSNQEYGMYELEGYWGDIVHTTGDFKIYLDWYREVIRRDNGKHRIINATEGGAKIEGAIQMSLEEAYAQYMANTSFDGKATVDALPEIWPTLSEKQEFLAESEKEYGNLCKISEKVKHSLEDCERLLALLHAGEEGSTRCNRYEQSVNQGASAIEKSKIYDALYASASNTVLQVQECLDGKQESDLRLEKIRLYEAIKDYLEGFNEAICRVMPFWEQVLSELWEQYGSDI